ncbi:MAG TPA: PHB depolymerase family esterase [Polyangiaceae bacterium]|nr:PHB depolymerase family esterase [Polyangiaceae bacterium]
MQLFDQERAKIAVSVLGLYSRAELALQPEALQAGLQVAGAGMTPSVRVSLHTSSAGLVFAMLSVAGCHAASGTVKGTSGAGGTNAFTAGGTAGSRAGAATGGASGSGGGAPEPSGGAPIGPSSSRHVARPVGSVPGATSGFWEYLPPHYGNGARYPLLVFLHGMGENGDGSLAALQKLPESGPPRLVKEDRWPADRKFIVLSPQHPGQGCPSSQEIHAFIQFALTHYDVDLTRVYLTGLSCGAIGSWNYLGDHGAEVVAAAVLVCGDGRDAFAKAGCALGRVPIWALHGELDPSVSPLGSTEPMAKLNACSPPPVAAKLTVYPGVKHDSWTRTYDLSAGNDVYGWLTKHQKR